MPRGLDSAIVSEFGNTEHALPIYAVRITRESGVLYWAERGDGTSSGDGSIVIDGQAYEARLMGVSGLEYGISDAAQISITVANVDGEVTDLDRAESFAGSRVDLLEFLPSLSPPEYSIRWSGYCDDLTDVTQESATIPAYPSNAAPNVMVPRRTCGIPCTHTFGNTANWVNARDFEGSECPYQRTSTVGFTATLQNNIDDSTDPATFTVRWAATPLAGGAAVKRGDEILIGSERMAVTNLPDTPDISGDQEVTCTRAVRGTTIAAHSVSDPVLFANCQYSVSACKARGMYGNNTADIYAGGQKIRNYFGGFPYVTGYQVGFYRTTKGGKANPMRLDFGGNESAYGQVLPLVYGKVRLNTAILVIADPEGDFLDTLWLVAEGPLATNADDDTQTSPQGAYVGGPSTPQIYVNGVSRHDPRPNWGIEAYNGVQDQPNPTSEFFPNAADFDAFNLGFWGTAWVAFRINTKENPSVDLKGGSVSGAFHIAFGRVVRVYSDATTYTRKPTTNGAFVLLDLMTALRAGGGLDFARINLQSIVDVAAYNDTLIDDTSDETSPIQQVKRWTFNGIIDTRKSLTEWMHLVCLQMYCLPPFVDANGKFKIKSLKAESLDSVPLFSSNAADGSRNIIWSGQRSSLRKSRRPIVDVPNEIRVGFVDKDTFSKVSVVVADREAQQELGRKLGDQTRRTVSKSVELPGVSTLDEALRIGTLILRAGEFAQGGLSNNLTIEFEAFYGEASDLEQGDIIECEDDSLNPALNEQYFRVIHLRDETQRTSDGGMYFIRTITATLHDNAIYDDGVLTISDFTRIDAPDSLNGPPPPVTAFAIVESGLFDANSKPMTQLVINFTAPSPLANFRSLLIYRSTDDAGSPVGDWRFVGEVVESGSAIQYEVSGKYEHFRAVSRATDGHPGDIDAQDSVGDPKYPTVRILVDGKADDQLAAPTNLAAFGRLDYIRLEWDAYTGNAAQLFKRFDIYRGTTSDPEASVQVAETDTNWYHDSSETVSTNPTTTYFYFIRGVSILEGVEVDGSPVDAISDYSSTASDNAGTDTDVPNAPTASVVFLSPVVALLGSQPPAIPVNWDTVETTQFQVATENTFAAPFFDETVSGAFATQNLTVNPGTYYLRTRAINIFGEGDWSGTETFTTSADTGAVDDDIPPAPINLDLVKADQTTGPKIAGNALQARFDYPVDDDDMASVWGYSVFIHTSATFPTTTTVETGSDGVLAPGSNRLTSPGASWTPSEWVSPDEHDIIIFSPKRTGSPSWDLEGMIYVTRITGNGSDWIDFDFPGRLNPHNWTGLEFYIVERGGNNHVWEKTSAVRLHVVDRNDLRSQRRVDFVLQGIGFRSWVCLHSSLWGAGLLAGPAGPINYSGIISGELGTASVETIKLADANTTAAKLTENARGFNTSVVFSATDQDTVAWASGTIKFADGAEFAISGGNTGEMGAATYIYLDPDTSTTVLQTSTTYSDATGDRKKLMCFARPGFDANQRAMFIPAVGTLGVNSDNLLVNSVTAGSILAGSITTAKLDALAVTAGKISVATLAAIAADLGTITGGTVTGALIRSAASGARTEQDSTNGFRCFDSGGGETMRIPLFGGMYFDGTNFPTGTGVFGTSVSVDFYVGGTEYAAVIEGGFTTVGSGEYKVQTGSPAEFVTAIDSDAKFVGPGGTDSDVDCFTNDRVFKPRFIEQSTVPSLSIGELVAWRYTSGSGGDNLYYLLYRDHTGAEHSWRETLV